ncbi:MAG: SRPBCC family protein [Limisphaerales bacterium]
MSSSRRSRSRHIRRIVGNLIVALLALIALALLVGLFLPRTYHVARSIDVKAGTEAIYPDLAGLRRWPEWTVWNKDLDPGIEWTYGSPDTGIGAEYSWVGPKVGDGRLKLVKADPEKGIAYELSFQKDSMRSEGEISMEKVAGGVRVEWTNHGDLGKNPVNRYFGLLMDRMIGPDFEAGLRRLKERAERGASSGVVTPSATPPAPTQAPAAGSGSTN